jgi:hypothetical protein
MATNGSTDVAETEALSQALGLLEGGDYSARLPHQASMPAELIDRLNHIFEQVQRREREAAARERELARELDNIRSDVADRKPTTREKRELLRALASVEEGDFSARIASRHVDSEVAQAFNRVVRLNARMADEFERVREAFLLY